MDAPLQADFRAFEDCLDLATIQDVKTLQSARCGYPLPGTRPRTRGEITLRTLQQPLNKRVRPNPSLSGWSNPSSKQREARMPAATTRTVPTPLRLITWSTSQRNLNGLVTFRPTLALVASALISAPTSRTMSTRPPGIGAVRLADRPDSA